MLGEKLKALRKAKKVTQVQLAAELNVANGTVAMWETEKREPDLKTIRRLAEFFDVPVGFLLGEDEKKPTPVSEDGLDEKDQRLVSWFRSLPEEKQKAILISQDAPEELF